MAPGEKNATLAPASPQILPQILSENPRAPAGAGKGSRMKKRRSAEQIVGLRRRADVESGKGASLPDACRRPGISQQTYCRWRTKFGGRDP